MRHQEKPASQRQAERELELALEEATRFGDKHESYGSIARQVYNERGDLIRQLAKPWALERMITMLRRMAARAATPETQLTIPGIDLPPVIRILKPGPQRSGKQKPQRIPLLDCTLPQLVEYRRELVKSLSSNKRVQEVDKAIALMRRHAPRSKTVTLRVLLEKHGQEILDFEHEVQP